MFKIVKGLWKVLAETATIIILPITCIIYRHDLFLFFSRYTYSEVDSLWILLLCTLLLGYLYVISIARLWKAFKRHNENIIVKFGIRWEYRHWKAGNNKVMARCRKHKTQLVQLKDAFVCAECGNPVVPNDAGKEISPDHAQTRVRLLFEKA